ncbi:hypothetical protein KIN20_018275 [Parelaphostrongylus tenuis]|uniref:Uncharacterized protein n=1 Tax=Parelaphostrongylus tenuis TaxID=148309 RepID=A0AAD5QS24_PARTN|nr:hypothetical protein KIN20_018272 [Parelaphostrongylus tenuis]KAJ1359517.1 hypothetical protein KIN20_018275 [Parelaphostrongylus tenuis]
MILTTGSFIILLLTTISTLSECGVIPAGEESSRNFTDFTVSGFTLPVSMVYARKPQISARVPGIAISEAGAKAFVQRFMTQTVLDALENLARNALLPDAVISKILSQLDIKINYEPMECQNVVLNVGEYVDPNSAPSCIVVGKTVTGIYNKNDGTHRWDASAIKPVPAKHLAISGTISTTNAIMANWTRIMWQRVLHRVARILMSGPLGSHFFSASVIVGRN